MGEVDSIRYICIQHNTTPHSVTRYTPFELMYGRIANLPGELQRGPISPLYNYEDLISNTRHKLKTSHEIARQNLIKSKLEQKERFDNTRAQPVKLEIGMKVLLSNESVKLGTSKKFTSPWTGLFIIIKVNDNGTVALQAIGKLTRKSSKRVQVVHANREKPYFSSLQDEDDNVD